MSVKPEFEGKVALITDGGGNIGRELACMFAGADASVTDQSVHVNGGLYWNG